MKKVLVTGGAGYIGSACVKALVSERYDVLVYDNLSTGQRDKVSSEVEMVSGDLLDLSKLRQVCQGHNFDAVVHFAGKKSVSESEVNPTLYFENNLLGSLNVLKVMEEFKIPQIIFSSTASVYETINNGIAITEESSIKPISVYGDTKLMVENMIKSFARVGKIKQFTILRYFNVAGDAGLNYQELEAKNVFPAIANKIKNDEPFEIFGNDYNTRDGTCIRDYIHLEDLIDGHLLALQSDYSGILNLGTGVGYSVKEVVDAFIENFGKKINVKISPRRSGDSATVVANATLAKEVLGWSPKRNLNDMIKDTIKAYSI